MCVPFVWRGGEENQTSCAEHGGVCWLLLKLLAWFLALHFCLDTASCRGKAEPTRAAAANGAGPKGEGGLDDAPGAGGSGGASHKQTSNTLDLGPPQVLCKQIIV